MSNREFRKKLEEGGTPKKLARMLSKAAEEIFVLLKKAAKLEKDGNHEAAEAATAEICSWLNGMNRFVETMAKMLTDEE
jgi:hypothetical protein